MIASLDKTAKPWSLVMQDPMGQKTSCMFPGSDFNHDSVAYLPHFYGQCEMNSIFSFNEDGNCVLIRSKEAEYISGETTKGSNSIIKQEICKTRQTILNGLQSLASHLDDPNLFHGADSMVGLHAEKAGAVLYVPKCAKVAVHIADFPYCTEDVPAIMDNSTKKKFMNPITHVVYPNYTLTSCDPTAPYMYKTAEGI